MTIGALAIRFIYLLFLTSFLAPVVLLGQHRIQGVVVDEDTDSRLMGVSVRVLGSSTGTSTDSVGQFVLVLDRPYAQVELTSIGYATKMVRITEQAPNMISMRPEGTLIEGITVRVSRKYSNRDNPAVELIDSVIRYKSQNRLSGNASIQFEQYDKIKIGIVDPPKLLKRTLSMVNFPTDNLDTLTLVGKEVLGIYQEENLARVYSQRDPSRSKRRIDHQVKTEFDQRYVNNPNIQSYINYVLQPIDIYDESIFMLDKLFLSPIADNGKVFYKYFLIDTVTNEHGKFMELEFVPRNEKDLLFRGKLQVAMDGSYAVKRAELHIGTSANLNWISAVDLRLNYSPRDGVMLLDSTHVAVSFGSENNQAMYGERMSVHRDYDLYSPIDISLFSGPPVEVLPDVSTFIPNRPVPLSVFERNTYENINRLKRDPTFRSTLALGYLIAQGYYNLNAFELGPLEYTYSRNNIEGNRIRLGGRTTPLLSEKMYVEGYLAYGTRDNDLKYYLSTAISVDGRNIATFPAHYVEGSIQHDILEPGRQPSFLRGDSFFDSFRRNRPTKWFMTDAYRLRHMVEFGNHFSVETAFSHIRRRTIGDFRLISSGDPTTAVRDINTNDVQVTLRWAPYERFYYRNLTRRTIIEQHPVFTVEYNKGLKGFLDAPYEYDMVKASASRRFFLNQFGFADMTFTAGKIWGVLPYTLLHMPNVRQKLDGRHEIRYDLMNSMEFAADEYVKFGFEHALNGFIFNKIPLLRRLKLREIWGAQMFYGRMSTQNDPARSDQVVEFDTDAQGFPLTRSLFGRPYWEASVGIDNILRVLRVEYVRRLTHRDFPNISQDRYRVSLSLNF
ncbi:DUF5686 and carboxypeptidase regulatory-like domain-containing protein [Sphingobacterium sp. lm-10]|uniref:DUF5686 family protein n=1 Tax=Sphingobacterium sp. lm-10 TaxID=2944904 RepID=UPI0020220207|nr:DUF5686 family protein [Sphingobacterium sp. lm-10]MCL7988332.1 DUF5686 and carboxypeptidase regulatory-like domain-containing protein [Sphingobacterium sp. lm-10]